MEQATKKYGANTEYRALHYWVEKQLGKPQACSTCSRTDRKRYHWANVSGQYLKDTSDWIRLCVSCHLRKDRVVRSTTHCLRGHELVPENLVKRKSGYADCLKCKRLYRKAQYQKDKLKEGTVANGL